MEDPDESNETPNKLAMKSSFIVSDAIHGSMIFHWILRLFIDTNHFQRLRSIKQLGGSYFVYPSAEHSRFVHSLGVAHLAEKLIKALRDRSPLAAAVDEKDVLCVTIAGLAHDLGHGPFSHVWEVFMKLQRPADRWRHEDQSLKILDDLLDRRGVWEELRRRGFEDVDRVFIKELISPPKARDDGGYPFVGRPIGKEFLYQIVANPVSGVDVDKFDYIARDSKQLGVDFSFDAGRFEALARVVEAPGDWWIMADGTRRPKLVIGVRDKDATNIVSLFQTRQDLHRKVYQHKTTKIVEKILSEIFGLVDDEEIFPVRGRDGAVFRLSTAHRDVDAFLSITNDILGEIMRLDETRVPEPKRRFLESAKDKISAIHERQFPKCVHAFNFNPKLYDDFLTQDEQKWAEELVSLHNTSSSFSSASSLSPSDVRFIVTTFDLGSGNEDPLSKIVFYRSDDTSVRLSMRQVSAILPIEFAEQKIFVFSVDPKKKETVRKAAEKWEETKKSEWVSSKMGRFSAPSEDAVTEYRRPDTPPPSQERAQAPPPPTKRGLNARRRILSEDH